MIYIIHNPARLRGNADQVRFRGKVVGGKKKRIISLLCLFGEKEPEKKRLFYTRNAYLSSQQRRGILTTRATVCVAHTLLL